MAYGAAVVLTTCVLWNFLLYMLLGGYYMLPGAYHSPKEPILIEFWESVVLGKGVVLSATERLCIAIYVQYAKHQGVTVLLGTIVWANTIMWLSPKSKQVI
jgi:hypothetical protein